MSDPTHGAAPPKGITLRSLSAPVIEPSARGKILSPLNSVNERAVTIPPDPQQSVAAPQNTNAPHRDITTSLDLMNHLQRSESSAVKTRTGSVLSRGFILKTDHYTSGKSLQAKAINGSPFKQSAPSGRALDLDLNIDGAPNFRAPRVGTLNVFGAAQPRTQGLRAILSILHCRPNTPNPTHVVWFSTREEPIVYISGRPFVLRDAAEPRRTLPMSNRAQNLEAIELRLKDDILQEAARFGGMVLTHNEELFPKVSEVGDGEGAILPTWTFVDNNNVKTSRELWEYMKSEGWNVDYYRIPISPDQPIEDNYLDAYLRVIRNLDPLRSALVFSCGMGAVRTTFAMVAASIVRRKQLIARGIPDPYIPKTHNNGTKSGRQTNSGTATPINPQSEARILQSLEQAISQQELSKSLLRLTYLLQQCLQSKNTQSAIELLMSHPALLENLRKAHLGNYSVILSLLGCLDHGLQAKRLVDKVIDATDQVTNLREDILINRLKYALTSMEEDQGTKFIQKARKALEKYFFIIAFTNYVDTSDINFEQTFSDWLKTRSEIWNQVEFLRKGDGFKLNVFAPVTDLSSLSKSSSEERVIVPGRKNVLAISGGQILGDEYSDHVVRNRSGIILRESTLLKSDQWLRKSHHVVDGVRGANNFRQVPGTTIYALGQPTLEAIDEVVRRIKVEHPHAQQIIWVTLREEPLVYINGTPYCLRREMFSLRNMKDYGGISASRLETLEERLRDDVVAELNTFGGRLLLHTETADGAVVPVWEEVKDEDVMVLKDIMASRQDEDGVQLQYARIPITAEGPPDFSDLNELIGVSLRVSRDTPIVVNCQLGRGRSTLASIILVLLRRWLDQPDTGTAPTSPRAYRSQPLPPVPSLVLDPLKSTTKNRYSYQVINNLLRVVRKGPRVRNIVDDAIDQCATIFNLRDSIEEARVRAEQATNYNEQKSYAQRGLQSLRRYFELIIFQSYLQSTQPDTMKNFQTIETYVENLPVIKTFEKELTAEGLNALKPLERADSKDGMADPGEVTAVVSNRSGAILSASTILKSDFFANLQKMTLPERIEGSPNFRRVPLTLIPKYSVRLNGTDFVVDETFGAKMVCGSGMPTVGGLKRALERVDAGPNGSNTVFWTSLREEPVIYITGRPHVLRRVDKPLENVEATGVTTEIVETIENNFKRDVFYEVRLGSGRILLHDEVEERPGVFTIVPIWESVTEDDIMTPRDVFELVQKEGYRIDYGRVAITDEQAPLPGALSQLLERIRTGLSQAGDFIFNCQMGRGRTTTGMVTACLISSTIDWKAQKSKRVAEEPSLDFYDTMDGPSEEEAYLQGEYKTILQLVGVLSHGKVAKRLTDRAIDLMQDMQNLRKAIYDYKLKVEALEKGSAKERKLSAIAVNYLYRYGTLITFANYLIEIRESQGPMVTFSEWLHEHHEITKLLERRSLD
ncbi:hypothetical protein AX15_004150 [Amanita polypyramis BW_CC]|nr:hypothetical protein AX15_004150 [Amanita polypyramis BW_CC]